MEFLNILLKEKLYIFNSVLRQLSTFPALSGTFAAHKNLNSQLHSKAAKEPSSPSLPLNEIGD